MRISLHFGMDILPQVHISTKYIQLLYSTSAATLQTVMTWESPRLPAKATLTDHHDWEITSRLAQPLLSSMVSQEHFARLVVLLIGVINTILPAKLGRKHTATASDTGSCPQFLHAGVQGIVWGLHSGTGRVFRLNSSSRGHVASRGAEESWPRPKPF